MMAPSRAHFSVCSEHIRNVMDAYLRLRSAAGNSSIRIRSNFRSSVLHVIGANHVRFAIASRVNKGDSKVDWRPGKDKTITPTESLPNSRTALLLSDCPQPHEEFFQEYSSSLYKALVESSEINSLRDR